MGFLRVFKLKILDSSQEEVLRVDALSEEIGTIQSLRNSFNPILGIILMALDAPAIFMRTKALRALGQIVTSDASILSAVSFLVFSLRFPLIDSVCCRQMFDVASRAIFSTVRLLFGMPLSS